MNLSFSLLNRDNFGLACAFHVSPSSCENPKHYDDYIRFSAFTDHISGMNTTHLLIDSDADRLAGYVSLRVSSMFYAGEFGETIGRPALEIEELAVDEEYEGIDCGTRLLDYSVYFADKIRSEMAGIRYILVCSDPSAVGFYEKYGFVRVNDIYDVPRDGYNANCIPMFFRFSE